MTGELLTAEAGIGSSGTSSCGGGSSWWWEPRLCLLSSAPCDPSASPLEAANARLRAQLCKQSRQSGGETVGRGGQNVVASRFRGTRALPQIHAITVIMNTVGNKRKRCCNTLRVDRIAKVPCGLDRLDPVCRSGLQSVLGTQERFLPLKSDPRFSL